MTVTVSLSESDYKLVQILKARDDASSDSEVLHKCLISAIDPTEAEIIAELMEQANELEEPIDERTMEGIRRGLEDMKHGRYRSLDVISKEMGI
ncbi:hypothetical protein ACKUB1_16305 [Methanospirillum stamsii]|uniref:Uncharacterized protein n=1 Tax=Methanospirillum stamsii TaxID=1277351 RepID=A0A2V2N4L3_9EURY|nr:hypothetical protein [Methanospirillum stamsii]PWR75042.1 hypothetical protein DLD82_07445 [Methanospirillum stamsii]